MLNIKKYKATITDSKIEVIGYISEIRKYIGNGCYGKGTDYLISVTEKSMPFGNYGNFKVNKDSIKEFKECPVCFVKEQKKEFRFFACSEKCYNKL